MRPFRSINRKNQVQKPLEISNTTTQSRLLSSFSKLTSNKKQISMINTVSYNQQSIELCSTPTTLLSSCYYPKQSTNNNNYIQRNTKPSSSQQNSPKINRISLTIQQKLQQKQNIIEHLKIELQQYKYIISSLKQQIKQLNYSEQEKNVNKVISNNDVVRCKHCKQMEHNMNQLKFLKNKQLQNNQFLQSYQEIIQKLTDKIHHLQSQNNILKQNNQNKKDNVFMINDFKQLNTKQSEFNPNYLNEIKIINVPHSLQQSRQSQEWGRKSDANKIVIAISKQNHPCTPKSNLPLSLQKSKLSGFKSTKFPQSQKQNHNQSSSLNLYKQPKSLKRSINSSPQKIRQKLTGKKSINLISQNIITTNQYQSIGLMKMGNKLDRKIYF